LNEKFTQQSASRGPRKRRGSGEHAVEPVEKLSGDNFNCNFAEFYFYFDEFLPSRAVN
jgi:hypothetical protein